MKRLVALLAVAGLAVALAAVAWARPAASPPVMTPGKLVVGFGDPAVNFANGKLRGSSYLNPKGYEVDLAAAIAKGLGLTPEYVYTPWAKLFAPGHKTFDISFQEATITAQRKKTVDFTSSYFDANQGVLLSKKAAVPHSLADLKKLQTCAQTDTTGLDWIQQKLHPDKAPLIYQSTAAAFVAVQIGRCDAIVLDTPIVASEKKARPTRYGSRRRPDHHARAVRRSARRRARHLLRWSTHRSRSSGRTAPSPSSRRSGSTSTSRRSRS